MKSCSIISLWNHYVSLSETPIAEEETKQIMVKDLFRLIFPCWTSRTDFKVLHAMPLFRVYAHSYALRFLVNAFHWISACRFYSSGLIRALICRNHIAFEENVTFTAPHTGCAVQIWGLDCCKICKKKEPFEKGLCSFLKHFAFTQLTWEIDKASLLWYFLWVQTLNVEFAQ